MKKQEIEWDSLFSNYKPSFKDKINNFRIRLAKTPEQKAEDRKFLIYLLFIKEKKKSGKKLTKEEKDMFGLFVPSFEKKLNKMNYEKEINWFKKKQKSDENWENQVLKVAEKLS